MGTRVIFSRRWNLGSLALRTVLWSPWSHTGTIDGDTVIEAVFWHGVVETPLTEVLKRSSRWAIVEYPTDYDGPCPARAEKGKKYDNLGVVGIWLHQIWSSLDRWFCSTLTNYDLEQRGLKLFRYTDRRITPQDLWKLNYPVIASK